MSVNTHGLCTSWANLSISVSLASICCWMDCKCAWYSSHSLDIVFNCCFALSSSLLVESNFCSKIGFSESVACSKASFLCSSSCSLWTSDSSWERMALTWAHSWPVSLRFASASSSLGLSYRKESTQVIKMKTNCIEPSPESIVKMCLCPPSTVMQVGPKFIDHGAACTW